MGNHDLYATLWQPVHCHAVRHDTVLIERLPGEPIRTLLVEARLYENALHAAGVALRHAHSLYSEYWHAGWSHGDPHLGNVLYDCEKGYAYLIDFETRHEMSLSADERHADDLLTFLLELMGSAPETQWLSWSTTFLVAYSAQPLLALLRTRLKIPHGLELVLWRTRTAHLSTSVLQTRLKQLSAFIDLKLY